MMENNKNPISWQPTHLCNEKVILRPLTTDDFEALYAVAADPLVWEQHPNKNRYERAVFQTFFDGAVDSKGAFVILDASDESVIGSSRFYNYDNVEHIIMIGYSFIARSYWGKGYNPSFKALMINYAFQYVSAIHFHVGAKNIRSQIAMQRLGATNIGVKPVAYHGEQEHLNIVFQITKQDWATINKSAFTN